MAVKHRCPFCRKVVRADGTCQNPSCVMYVPDESKEETKNNTEEKSE